MPLAPRQITNGHIFSRLPPVLQTSGGNTVTCANVGVNAI
jgi:hypothetical protein